MELFEILKTMLQILKRMLQFLAQCFKFGRVVQTINNHKTDIAGDDGLHLPEEIIQRIQYFLNGKEAAQTTLLSKSWRRAWSTRPNLDIDERHFQESNEVSNQLPTVEQLLQFAKKKMQRYDDLKLNIETFRLHIDNEMFCKEKRESRYLSLANEVLEKAMKLEAVDLDITLSNHYFVLPDSVLRSETLARLSLLGGFFTFDFKRLTYSKLKSLSLSQVHVDVETLSDSDEFPNLECMYLYYFTKGAFLNDASFFSRFSSLKELVFSDGFDSRNIRICSKSLERITWTVVYHDRLLSAEFDVPNLRRFKLVGSGWTRLAFKTTCREWESDIVLRCSAANIGVDWFINLNKLLTDLSMSRVSLSIYVYGNKPTDSCGGLVGAALLLPTPQVKELTLKVHEFINTSFLDNLFLICRPTLIIPKEYFFEADVIEKYLLELVCKGILEEVNLEVWETASHEWRCVQLNHRRHDNIANDVDHNSTRLMFALQTSFRFQLRWMEPSRPK